MSQTDIDMWTTMEEEPAADASARHTSKQQVLRYDADSSPDQGNICASCGHHVSAAFQRVMVPEDREPQACRNCAGPAQLRTGAAVNGVSDGSAGRESSSTIAREQRVDAVSHSITGP